MHDVCKLMVKLLYYVLDLLSETIKKLIMFAIWFSTIELQFFICLVPKRRSGFSVSDRKYNKGEWTRLNQLEIFTGCSPNKTIQVILTNSLEAINY